jgi:serine/threonine protein kinase
LKKTLLKLVAELSILPSEFLNLNCVDSLRISSWISCSTLHSNKSTQTISIRYTIDLQTKIAKRQRESIVNEVCNLRTTVHPNVARLLDVCLVGRHDLWLTMEDISGIRLADIIKDNNLREDQVSCLCRQVRSSE